MGARATDTVVYHSLVGDYDEGYEWEIRRDVNVDDNETPYCLHRVTRGGHQFIPRMIVAFNKGKYNCTEVCLDCVLAAVKSLDG